MDWGIFELSTGLLVLILAIYYYFKSPYDFWNSRKVAGPKPSLLFGNFKDLMLSRLSVGDYTTKIYNEFKNEPFIGVYARRTPVLLVNDPEYIKDVLIKDFTVFADRGLKIFEKIEPLGQHLFLLEPARWRPLRIKLSPTFTSGKLKEMFYLLAESADHFEQYLEEYTKNNSVIDCLEITAKFTTDVIGVCAFGLKMNALDKEDSEFRNVGRKFFSVNTMKILKMRIREALPWLYKLLGPLMYDHEINDFFINTMKQTMDYRRKNKIKRGDFVDLLMAIRDDPSQVGDIGKSFMATFFMHDALKIYNNYNFDENFF